MSSLGYFVDEDNLLLPSPFASSLLGSGIVESPVLKARRPRHCSPIYDGGTARNCVELSND